ncbi:DUF4124 domain-containing protein [Thauera aromatica]|uniref:DUF4124 domain-containing protein n=1 Tax=Thauera aromatica TaxID=59405 RepID=UPI001FFC75E7|nr:DUF4124 domain-containing protein [Thauera aromatica]MCK2088096.1 DUF4124 domain-containing protein [Thauera aromatica]
MPPAPRLPILCAAAIPAALLIATAAHAQVYKCRIDGQAVFADRPCATDAQPLDIRPAAGPGTPPAPGAPTTLDKINASVDEMVRSRQLRELDHRLRVERADLEQEQDRMNRELAALRNKKDRANTNLAGAMWEQSISEEMNATVARYDLRMRGIRDEIKRLEEQRAGMVGR